MIKPRDYNAYLDTVRSKISAITDSFIVSNESGLKEIVKALGNDDVILVSVIPNSDQKGSDIDSIHEINHTFLFVLQREKKISNSYDDFITQMDMLCETMAAVKTQIAIDSVDTSSGCPFCQRLDLSSLHTDPEYNYLGCNGYSVSLGFNTKGF